jgi:ATP/maltotriose-dependent transcriptional regulator MalT
LGRAIEVASQAVRDAERLGDRQLAAQAIAGVAEIHVARGESELAKQQVERALAVHRELKDPVREAEDLRILAGAVALSGGTQEAVAMLRDVIDRATQHGRPMLLASAERDFARLLIASGDVTSGKAAAQRARAIFQRLSARAETDKLDALLEAP